MNLTRIVLVLCQRHATQQKAIAANKWELLTDAIESQSSEEFWDFFVIRVMTGDRFAERNAYCIIFAR